MYSFPSSVPLIFHSNKAFIVSVGILDATDKRAWQIKFRMSSYGMCLLLLRRIL